MIVSLSLTKTQNVLSEMSLWHVFFMRNIMKKLTRNSSIIFIFTSSYAFSYVMTDDQILKMLSRINGIEMVDLQCVFDCVELTHQILQTSNRNPCNGIHTAFHLYVFFDVLLSG
jgi:hypothetical protein